MKLLNKFLYMSLVAACFAFTGCAGDDDDYMEGTPTDANCPALTFGADNTSSIELDPEAPTEATITVYRGNAEGDGTYNLKVVQNQDDIFTVPATVTFAAGASEATIPVSFNGAEVGVTYTLEVALEDKDVDAYSENTFTSYVLDCVRVKWNTLGTGQWLDGFFVYEGFWTEVPVQQRDDKPEMFRIPNVYADGTAYFVFELSANGYISYDYLDINTLYSEGAPIYGYYPSYLDESLASDDVKSYAKFNEDGTIRYFVIDPYWYVPGVGGWGCGYPCYVAFPGVDLATELEWGAE